MMLDDYNNCMPVETAGCSIKKPGIYQKLKQEKNILTERLKNINSVLEAMDKNPEVSEILIAISKI